MLQILMLLTTLEPVCYVPFVEIVLQGSITEHPVVMAAKDSSEEVSGRTICILAGKEGRVNRKFTKMIK